MSYFDKFMKDINKRSEKKQEKVETANKEIAAREAYRQRVNRYRELVQNRIRWNRSDKK
tara:strand:+ start:200 stop:376 length:177 start_codon:yes stop_codon:yes gene_type:complete